MNSNYYTIEPTINKLGANYNSWQPSRVSNDTLVYKSGINSNWKYRQYIQKNANDIMKYNTMETITNSGNNPYVLLNTQPSQNTPYIYQSIHETENPTCGYTNSDLKQDYIQSHRRKARMIAPSIPITTQINN